MKLGQFPVSFPRAFSICCRDSDTDYSASARDVAIETKLVYRINSEIEGANGRTLLTGWCETAAIKCTFYVGSPLSVEKAMNAVRSAIREIQRTVSVFLNTEEHYRPIITNVPIGCRMIGAPEIVNKPRPREVTYLADFLGAIKDGFQKNVQYIDAFCAANPLTA